MGTAISASQKITTYHIAIERVLPQACLSYKSLEPTGILSPLGTNSLTSQSRGRWREGKHIRLPQGHCCTVWQLERGSGRRGEKIIFLPKTSKERRWSVMKLSTLFLRKDAEFRGQNCTLCDAVLITDYYLRGKE